MINNINCSNNKIKPSKPSTTLHGKEVVFNSGIVTSNRGSQCPGCVYYNENNVDCPTDSYSELICNEDITGQWQYVEASASNTEQNPVPKPPEAPAGRKYDSGKPMYALVPADALEEVAKVLTAGAVKYNEPLDEENWRKVDSPYFRYFSAAQRHMADDRRGKLIDTDVLNKDGTISKGTQCYHLACAIASLMFMLQLRMEEAK